MRQLNHITIFTQLLHSFTACLAMAGCLLSIIQGNPQSRDLAWPLKFNPSGIQKKAYPTLPIWYMVLITLSSAPCSYIPGTGTRFSHFHFFIMNLAAPKVNHTIQIPIHQVPIATG